MGRSPCCSKVGLRRGPWSSQEDKLLADFIHQNGEGQWRSLPKKAGLLRCGKSCRLRWMNYLRPGIVRGNISQDEEDLIVRLHRLLGNRWSLIAGRLPGRTDNEIKNYWNTHLLKKLINSDPDSKPSGAGGHRTKKPKKKRSLSLPQHRASDDHVQSAQIDDDAPKTKVYLPKPIRISGSFPRTDSLDSLTGGSGSCGSDRAAESKGEVEDYVATVWPVFELEDVGGCDGEDDLFGGYCVMPLLDQVYDEYLQLLQ